MFLFKQLPKYMHYLLIGIIGLLLSILINNCTETFNPKIDKYESLLVVDALLTNQPGSCRVILSNTYAYDEGFTTYVDGAHISLLDEFGNTYPLTSIRAGYYAINDSSFMAVVGHKYKIYIELSNGQKCESYFETLTEPVPIDSIYWEFSNSSEPENTGLQILLDVQNYDKKNANFSWDYAETWEFEVPYTSPYYEGFTTCYKTVRPALFLIKSVTDYDSKKLLSYPLYFIDNTTNRLYIKYSVLITQHTLSDSTYNFLKDLKQINEEQGTLYDKTPEILTGNFVNLSNPEIPILGNFQASGTFSKRIFIETDDLPAGLNPPSGYEYCESEYLSIFTQQSRIDSLTNEAGWIVIDTIAYINPMDTVVGVSKKLSCVNCKISGSITKPSFWDEN